MKRGSPSCRIRNTFLTAVSVPVICTVNGQKQASTAFLVGSFDLAVTVAHTFVSGSAQVNPSDCVYTSTDSTGQIRERLPVVIYKSQWIEANAAGVPAKDLAIVRLAQGSAFAHRTLPLGLRAQRRQYDDRLHGRHGHRHLQAQVARHDTGKKASPAVADIFTHDMDAVNLASGAPVLDERSGVIIGVHTSLMLDAAGDGGTHCSRPRCHCAQRTDHHEWWLENTLRAEIALTLSKADAAADLRPGLRRSPSAALPTAPAFRRNRPNNRAPPCGALVVMSAPALPPASERDVDRLTTLLRASTRAVVSQELASAPNRGFRISVGRTGAWTTKPYPFPRVHCLAKARQEAWRRRFSNEGGWLGWREAECGHAAVAQLYAWAKSQPSSHRMWTTCIRIRASPRST